MGDMTSLFNTSEPCDQSSYFKADVLTSVLLSEQRSDGGDCLKWGDLVIELICFKEGRLTSGCLLKGRPE